MPQVGDGCGTASQHRTPQRRGVRISRPHPRRLVTVLLFIPKDEPFAASVLSALLRTLFILSVLLSLPRFVIFSFFTFPGVLFFFTIFCHFIFRPIFLLSFFSRWVYLFFFIASSLYIPLNILCVLQLSILFSSNFAHFFPFFPLPYFIFSRFISLYLFFLFSFARPSLPLCPASLTYSVPPLNHVLPTPTQHLLRAPHPASCVGRHVARSLYCKEYSKRCPVPSR